MGGDRFPGDLLTTIRTDMHIYRESAVFAIDPEDDEDEDEEAGSALQGAPDDAE